jgi:hypothetical protein
LIAALLLAWLELYLCTQAALNHENGHNWASLRLVQSRAGEGIDRDIYATGKKIFQAE